jgi:hypothetical protein
MLIDSLRQAGPEAMGQVDVDATAAGYAVFNDLDFKQTLTLVTGTADLIRFVRDVPGGRYGPAVASDEIELGPYLFVIMVADYRQAPQLLNLITQKQHKHVGRTDYPPLMVMCTLVGRPQGFSTLVMKLPAQTGDTQAAKALKLTPSVRSVA